MTSHAEIELLGRRVILASLKQLLQARRSVLLVGPAGIGKSALEAEIQRGSPRPDAPEGRH